MEREGERVIKGEGKVGERSERREGRRENGD